MSCKGKARASRDTSLSRLDALCVVDNRGVSGVTLPGWAPRGHFRVRRIPYPFAFFPITALGSMMSKGYRFGVMGWLSGAGFPDRHGALRKLGRRAAEPKPAALRRPNSRHGRASPAGCTNGCVPRLAQGV